MRTAPTCAGSCPLPPPAAEGSRTAAVAGVGRTNTLDVTLTTRDGDTVTISASRTSSIAAAAVAGGSPGATAIARSDTATFSMSVEGSLDHRELVDLAKVTRLLARAASGRHADAILKRLSRPDLDTVASVTASAMQSLTVIAGMLTLAPAAQEPVGTGTSEPAGPSPDTALPDENAPDATQDETAPASAA